MDYLACALGVALQVLRHMCWNEENMLSENCACPSENTQHLLLPRRAEEYKLPCYNTRIVSEVGRSVHIGI